VIGHILSDLFGPGTWGAGGNLLVEVAISVPAIVITHVRAHRQRERHHQDMKKHVTNSAGGDSANR